MTTPRSAWNMRYAVLGFLIVLTKLKLTTHMALKTQQDGLVRRYASRYDTSPITHSAYNDGMR